VTHNLLRLLNTSLDLRDLAMRLTISLILNLILLDDPQGLLRIQLALSDMASIAGTRRHST